MERSKIPAGTVQLMSAAVSPEFLIYTKTYEVTLNPEAFLDFVTQHGVDAAKRDLGAALVDALLSATDPKAISLLNLEP